MLDDDERHDEERDERPRSSDKRNDYLTDDAHNAAPLPRLAGQDLQDEADGCGNHCPHEDRDDSLGCAGQPGADVGVASLKPFMRGKNEGRVEKDDDEIGGDVEAEYGDQVDGGVRAIFQPLEGTDAECDAKERQRDKDKANR